MRGMRGFVVVCVGLVLLGCMAAEAKDQSGVKTVLVDCDTGDSINQALAVKADELIIEIRGTCQEDVIITRDDVTLRGLDPDATVVAQANQAIWIDRALRVTLENLMVTGSTGPGITGVGIFIVHSSGVVVSDVRSEGNRQGIRTYGSSLRILDSDFCRNFGGGLYIANGSSLILDGEEINASENGGYGLLVSESAVRSPWVGNPRIVANDNGFAGVELQFSAHVTLAGGLEAKRNDNGIYVQGGSLWVEGGSVDISENGWGVITDGADAVINIGGEGVSVTRNGGGLAASEGATIIFKGTVSYSDWGGCAGASGGARIFLQETVCQNNGWGVFVHGGTARIQDSTIQENEVFDVVLSFGARATFEGANDVGYVACDTTVLLEGDVECDDMELLKGGGSGPAAKGMRGSSPPMGRVAPMSRQSGDPMAPRLLP